MDSTGLIEYTTQDWALQALAMSLQMEKDRRYVAVCTLGKQKGAV